MMLNDRTALVNALQGQSASIPDLLALFPAWSQRRHPGIDTVNQWIDEWLASIPIDKQTKIKHRRKGNYVLSTAAYYPDTTLEQLFVLSQFQYWIFFWDDDIDSGGYLADDSAGTRQCCFETKTVIDACLSEHLSTSEVSASARPTVSILPPILLQMRTSIRPETIERLRRDLHEYVDGVIRQQAARNHSVLPDADANLNMRADDIGVKPCITQAEYAMDFTLDTALYDLPEVQRLIRLSAELVVLVNELVSFQKEALDGQVENFVILHAYQKQVSIRTSVTHAVAMIQDRYEEFEEIEKKLRVNVAGDDLRAIDGYIQASKALVTGTAWWSYECGRYFQPQQVDRDGIAHVQLRFQTQA